MVGSALLLHYVTDVAEGLRCSRCWQKRFVWPGVTWKRDVSNGLCRAISELSKPIKNPTPSFSKRTETIVDSKRNAGFFFLHAVIQFKCSTLPHVRCCSFIFSTFSTDLIVIFSIHKSRHWGNKRHANFNLFFFFITVGFYELQMLDAPGLPL